ncbi:hypothetical protein PR048_015287 [Dryococelus australis]|uniref:Endonuclease-reverse transcriptase n=1 Tax=Dryococelus australis TaxID=614101 RepID=A0ABQ9HGN3_9NEOP|nr:hypothetical protein PR048_015287 [Dryococelus australis]
MRVKRVKYGAAPECNILCYSLLLRRLAIPEKTRRPTATSDTIPTCENPGVTQQESYPGGGKGLRYALATRVEDDRKSLHCRRASAYDWLSTPPRLRELFDIIHRESMGQCWVNAQETKYLFDSYLVCAVVAQKRTASALKMSSYNEQLHASDQPATRRRSAGDFCKLRTSRKREIPKKSRRPAASSGTIPTCKNPGVTRLGIEPGSPWWEASSLTAEPPRRNQKRWSKFDVILHRLFTVRKPMWNLPRRVGRVQLPNLVRNLAVQDGKYHDGCHTSPYTGRYDGPLHKLLRNLVSCNIAFKGVMRRRWWRRGVCFALLAQQGRQGGGGGEAKVYAGGTKGCRRGEEGSLRRDERQICSRLAILPENKHIWANKRVVWWVLRGQLVNMEGDVRPEIFRRIQLEWQAYRKNSIVFKSNMPINLKKTVYDQCILPVLLTYGCETWTLDEFTKGKLRTAQRAMERSMLGFTRKDKIKATNIRSVTKVKAILEKTATLKWQWTGHVARTKDERWTKTVLEWSPRNHRRPRGRPTDHWDKDIRRVAGSSAGIQEEGGGEIAMETRQVASSGTILICENPGATPPGIEPDEFPVRKSSWASVTSEAPGGEPPTLRLQVGHPTPELRRLHSPTTLAFRILAGAIFACEVEKRGSDKGHAVTCIKCAIASTGKALKKRTVFS